jgi:hypothetical protein
MNAADALALSVRNDVYLIVDGTEKFVQTGCFVAQAGVRMAGFRLEDGTWVHVPADSDVIVRVEGE